MEPDPIFSAKSLRDLYRWRSVNAVVYFIDQAASHQELDKVLRLTRDPKAAQKIVRHVRIPDNTAPLTTDR